MLYQEDIMIYFDGLATQMREENIPIYNNVIRDYPGFISADKIVDPADNSDESEEDL